MQFEFSNINTPYIQADVIASITNENKNAAKSNISSVYDSKDLNLDAAVLSISSKGTARINAMLSKSIQLRATSYDPNLTAAERLQVSNELRDIRKEISNIRTTDSAKTSDAADTKQTSAAAEATKETVTKPENDTVEITEENADKMIEASMENILKQANDSIQIQNLNRDHVLQLL